jgi:hypothetical protein
MNCLCLPLILQAANFGRLKASRCFYNNSPQDSSDYVHSIPHQLELDNRVSQKLRNQHGGLHQNHAAI